MQRVVLKKYLAVATILMTNVDPGNTRLDQKEKRKTEKKNPEERMTHFHGNSELLYYANSVASCSFLHAAPFHGIIVARGCFRRFAIHRGEMEEFRKELAERMNGDSWIVVTVKENSCDRLDYIEKQRPDRGSA